MTHGVVCIQLLETDDKQSALRATISAVCGREHAPSAFVVDPRSFAQVPGSPFAYWVSDRIRHAFKELPKFEDGGRFARVGLQTSDDFRFIRCWWEARAAALLDSAKGPPWHRGIEAFQAWCRERTFQGKRWIPIAKGGSFAPFFDEPQMIVNWERNGDEIRTFTDARTGKTYSRPQNVESYFRPGMTWPLRGIRLSVQAVPAGCCFSVAGKLATCDDSRELLPLLGIMNTSLFDYLVGFFAGKVGGVQYEVGLIGRVPVPRDVVNQKLAEMSEAAYRAACSSATLDERRHSFAGFRFRRTLRSSFEDHDERTRIAKAELDGRQCELDELVLTLYRLGPREQEVMQSRFFANNAELDGAETDDPPEPPQSDAARITLDPAADALSYAVGCIFARWDVCFATGEKQPPDSRDPFDPLPVCSPGMLQGDDGLPLTKTPEGYPLKIDWDGILVDDANHPDDIVRRVRDVLEVIWPDRAEAIEQEACEILGVKQLRDYFRKPAKGGFWDDHVARYSKSRRKAPIYWLLQSSKKNYALWLYYHRLDKDLLFKALVNYVEPKLQREANRLDEMRRQKQATALTPALSPRERGCSATIRFPL